MEFCTGRVGDRRQLVLPEIFKGRVLKHLHNDMGHVCVRPGKRKILLGLYAKVEEYVNKKCSCIKKKWRNIEQWAPMGKLTSSAPLN